jgi:NAD(P)-dependent dehydrogenase (short-subunit alcohol dehydrogenase family)
MRISKEVSMTPPVCLILGAGAGIGGHVAKRFARDGYHGCVARRSDQAGLDKLVAEINATGGSASGHLLNAVEEGSIEQLVTSIEADLGRSAWTFEPDLRARSDLAWWNHAPNPDLK